MFSENEENVILGFSLLERLEEPIYYVALATLLQPNGNALISDIPTDTQDVVLAELLRNSEKLHPILQTSIIKIGLFNDNPDIQSQALNLVRKIAQTPSDIYDVLGFKPRNLWHLFHKNQVPIATGLGIIEILQSYGIFTNLQQLILKGMNLKYLPYSIGNQTDLKTLNLRENQLTTLPQSIGNLTNLEQLDLFNNPLKTLPKSIENWENLMYLNLCHTSLRLASIDWIDFTMFPKLETLMLPVKLSPKRHSDLIESGFKYDKQYVFLGGMYEQPHSGRYCHEYISIKDQQDSYDEEYDSEEEKNNPQKKLTRRRIKKNTGKKDFLENLKNEAKIILSPEFYYGSAADLVLQKGHFPKISKALSEEQIAYVKSVIQDSMIANEGARMGNCYHNVFALILADYQDRMNFVEGFASTSNGIIFHHAWVELDDEYIVDLTWSNDEEKNQKRIRSETTQCSLDISDRVLGEIPHGYNYLGVIIPKEDVEDFFYKNRVTSLLLQSYRNNFMFLREEWI